MSSNTWFTSDHHFGHVNILQFERDARPFTDVREMNEYLIHTWNSVVRPCDVVFHLGDFCFGKQNLPLAARLHGKKRLILGNHDTYANSDYLKYFDHLYGAKFWEQCLLTHVPVHPSNINGYRCKVNLHGHLHSKQVTFAYEDWGGDMIYPPDFRYFNVSIERHNLIPVSADIIRDHIATHLKTPQGNPHE